MIVDGKMLAARVYEELKTQIDTSLRLGIVVVGDDPVIDSFVRIKRRNADMLGVAVVEKRLPSTSSFDEIALAIRECVSETHGVIVQLPLPSHIDTDRVLAEIPLSHDVDGLSTREGARIVHAPVAEAITYILKFHDVSVADKKIVVVGNGRLVGSPTAEILKAHGAQDLVVLTRETYDPQALLSADIIVLGAGDPQFLKPDMIHDGCVVLDAGTSESAGKIVGDADPACAEKCSLFTPVPGGIGPIAVAMIFKNLYTLVQK